MFTPGELKRRAMDFAREHADDMDEKQQAQVFWYEFFAVFGLSAKRIGGFEARAKTLKQNVGFIDFFWPGTLLIEHKSRGRDLEEALKQALDYCTTGGLKDEELPRFILLCDFDRFILLELAGGKREEFRLAELHEKLHLFDFVLGREQRVYKEEDPVNIQAAELMGTLHDELRRVGFEGHQLELFLVRLMFCFFADDTGIFQKDQFADYLEARSREDGSDLGEIIASVFRVLDTAPEKRPTNLGDDLAALPYVNGHLFADHLDPPYFDATLRAILLHCARFNWGQVSPAIFGSLFQSVMDPSQRRALGAHYTSEKNILKTIHGLFLDELEEEFSRIKARKVDREKLYRALLERIAGIRLLDPACGCGNFLILAYRELRRLELRIQRELRDLSGDTGLSLDMGWEGRGITVDHIYGIEIEEFPSQIARVALWIMDHLMNVELSATLGGYRPSIPLVTSPHIVHGNALRLDWKEIVKPEELTYILGNPPFVGKTYQSKEQREDQALNLGNLKNGADLDFVANWHYKAAQYIQCGERHRIKVGFVSTNSITQGEQVPALWAPLLQQLQIKIHFAHRTFKWTNEAKGKAAVHVIIIGFSNYDIEEKQLFDYPDVGGEATVSTAKNINPYLIPARDVVIAKQRTTFCNFPEMHLGSKPTDDGNFLLTQEEYEEYAEEEPEGTHYIRKYVGSTEYINGIDRYCFWLKSVDPKELRQLPVLKKRIEAVAAFRAASTAKPTLEMANYPTLFFYDGQPDDNYILVPQTSSEKRRFIPIGFISPDMIASNACYVVPTSSLYVFGCLISTMHMAWVRAISGRLKSDYQYSGSMVYNNFPWPSGGHPPGATSAGSGGGAPGEGVAEDAAAAGARGRLPPSQEKIEKAAQAVLDARAAHPGCSLADLYDPLSMPADLVKAHRELDRAVDAAYRKAPFESELERVEFLFALYEEYTAGLTAGLAAGLAAGLTAGLAAGRRTGLAADRKALAPGPAAGRLTGAPAERDGLRPTGPTR